MTIERHNCLIFEMDKALKKAMPNDRAIPTQSTHGLTMHLCAKAHMAIINPRIADSIAAIIRPLDIFIF